jgi:hypothetical protein
MTLHGERIPFGRADDRLDGLHFELAYPAGTGEIVKKLPRKSIEPGIFSRFFLDFVRRCLKNGCGSSSVAERQLRI